MPGLAHLSNKAFGKRGFWGRPWRTNREFVGRVNYGVRWKMRRPLAQKAWPPHSEGRGAQKACPP